MKVTCWMKQRITKMFKSGKTIDQIMLAVPDVTATDINRVVRKHLFSLADELWSTAVKIGGRCEISGETYNLEAHHPIRRDNLTYRWDLNNGVCLNNLVHSQADTDKEAFEELLAERQPEKWGWYEKHKYEGGKPVKNDELLQICKSLRQFIERSLYDARRKDIGARDRVGQAM